MTDDEDLWSDEINAFVDAAFDSGIVSRNPSDAEQHIAYRYAIKLAIDETRQPQPDALKIARERGDELHGQLMRMIDRWEQQHAALEARGLEIREKGQ
jgi:hypothetical protein